MSVAARRRRVLRAYAPPVPEADYPTQPGSVGTVATVPSVVGGPPPAPKRTIPPHQLRRLERATPERRQKMLEAVKAIETIEPEVFTQAVEPEPEPIDPEIARQIAPYVSAEGQLDILAMSAKLGDVKTIDLLQHADIFLTPDLLKLMRGGRVLTQEFTPEQLEWVTKELARKERELAGLEETGGRAGRKAATVRLETKRRQLETEIAQLRVLQDPFDPQRDVLLGNIDLETWCALTKDTGLEGYQFKLALNNWRSMAIPIKRGPGVRLGQKEAEEKLQAMVETLPPHLRKWFDENLALAVQQETEWSAEYERRYAEALKKVDPQFFARHGRIPWDQAETLIAQIYPKDHPRYQQAREALKYPRVSGSVGGTATPSPSAAPKDIETGIWEVVAADGTVRQVVANSQFGAFMQYWKETGKDVGVYLEPNCPKNADQNATITKVGALTVKGAVSEWDAANIGAAAFQAGKVASGGVLISPRISVTSKAVALKPDDLPNQVYEFRLDTQRGEKVIRAVNKEQALRLAVVAGLEVKGVTSSMLVTMTDAERMQVLLTAETRSPSAYAEAYIAHSGVYGPDYRLPSDSVPVLVSVRDYNINTPEGVKTVTAVDEWSALQQLEDEGLEDLSVVSVGGPRKMYLYFDPDTIDFVKEHPIYKATGQTDAEKFAAALAAWQKAIHELRDFMLEHSFFQVASADSGDEDYQAQWIIANKVPVWEITDEADGTTVLIAASSESNARLAYLEQTGKPPSVIRTVACPPGAGPPTATVQRIGEVGVLGAPTGQAVVDAARESVGTGAASVGDLIIWAERGEPDDPLAEAPEDEINIGGLIESKGEDGATAILRDAGISDAQEVVKAFVSMPEHWQEYASVHGLSALGDQITRHSSVLAPYKTEVDGEETYDIYSALLDPTDWETAGRHHDAIEFLFGEDMLTEARGVLRKERIVIKAPTPVPGPEYDYTGKPWYTKLKEFITPWEEETGQTFTDWMQRPGTIIGDFRRGLTEDEAFKTWYDEQGYPELVYGYGPMFVPMVGTVAPVLAKAPTLIKGIGKGIGYAGKWYWKLPARMVTRAAVGLEGRLAATKIPYVLYKPLVAGGFVPKIAIDAIRMLAFKAPVIIGAAFIAEKIRDQDVYRKWDILQNLPDVEKDNCAQKAGYEKWDGLTENEQAAVLAVYSVPADYSTTGWQREYGQFVEKAAKGAESWGEKAIKLREVIEKGELPGKEQLDDLAQAGFIPPEVGEDIERRLKYILGILAVGAGGAAAFGLGVGAGLLRKVGIKAVQMPLMVSNIMVRVPTGEAAPYAMNIARGMLSYFATLPLSVASSPFKAGEAVGIFILSPESVYKMMQSGFAKMQIHHYMPERGLGFSKNTLRVDLFPKDVFTARQMKIMANMTPEQRMKLGTEIGAAIMRGENYVKGFGMFKLEVLTTAYQKGVGDSLFHFTPDMRPFLKGKPVSITGKLYSSPHAAMAAGIQSLVKGQKAVKPGVVEIRVPRGYTIKGAPIEKLIGAGKVVEIEAPLQGVLDPIKGWTGKGVSWNVYLGSYPIRRFTLRGAKGDIPKITLSKLDAARELASIDAIADFFLGWKGRLAAIKGDIAASRQLNTILRSISNSAKSVKKAPNSQVGKDGRIISQIEFKHPVKGLVNEKVRGLIVHYDPKTKTYSVLFARDRADAPGTYDAIGGSCNPKQVLIPATGKWNYQLPANARPAVTWALAFASQARGELNIIVKHIKSLGMYRGKTGAYSVHGVRVFESRVGSKYFDNVKAWNLFQRKTFGYKQPEIAEAFWWDGKSVPKGAVQPWFYDMMAAVAHKYGWDMSKVKVVSGSHGFARDPGFITRVRANQNFDLTSAQRKAAELSALRGSYDSITEPGFWDYVTRAGINLQLASEIIFGRRNAVKWTVTKPKDLPRAAKEIISTQESLVRQIQKMSTKDVLAEFGQAKAKLLKALETASLKQLLAQYQKTPTAALSKQLSAIIMKTAGRQAKLMNTWFNSSRFIGKMDAQAINSYYADYAHRYTGAAAAGVPVSLAMYHWDGSTRKDFPGAVKVDPNYKAALQYEPRAYLSMDMRSPGAVSISYTPKYTPHEYVEKGYVRYDYSPGGYVSPSYLRAITNPTTYAGLTVPRTEYHPYLRADYRPYLQPTPTPYRQPEKYKFPTKVIPLKEPFREPTELPYPERQPPRRPPVPPPPRPPVLLEMEEEEKRVKLPAGAITWAQGALRRGKQNVPQWYYIPPPYDQKDAIPIQGPPIGARHTDSVVPRETIQMIGEPEARVPREVKKDLGWADVIIRSGREIEFAGGGLETNIGVRIPLTTKGIAIGEGPADLPTKVVSPKQRIVAASPAGFAVPEGSMAWADGFMDRGKARVQIPQWYYLPPPYDGDPIPLPGPPRKAEYHDSADPHKTLQIIGRPRTAVPASVERDLGWARVSVADGKVELAKTLASEALMVEEMDTELLEPIAPTPKTRVGLTTKKSKRKISDWDHITTLRGYDAYTGRGG